MNLDSTPVATSQLAIGNRIRIKDGPLQDFEGKICEIDRQAERVSVLFDWFGTERRVELKASQVAHIV